jgi:hypothetical protein
MVNFFETPDELSKRLRLTESALKLLVATDPDFPRPFFIAEQPLFNSQEIDIWAAKFRSHSDWSRRVQRAGNRHFEERSEYATDEI